MLTEQQRAFLEASRVGRLATADAHGAPHVIPVCYAVCNDSAYITVDQKPKRRPGHELKRVRNIIENRNVALVIDRYDEDWSRLAWVMLRGHAEILRSGDEHVGAQAHLRARYPQLTAMSIESLPVIAIRITRASSWGALDAA